MSVYPIVKVKLLQLKYISDGKNLCYICCEMTTKQSIMTNLKKYYYEKNGFKDFMHASVYIFIIFTFTYIYVIALEKKIKRIEL